MSAARRYWLFVDAMRAVLATNRQLQRQYAAAADACLTRIPRADGVSR